MSSPGKKHRNIHNHFKRLPDGSLSDLELLFSKGIVEKKELVNPEFLINTDIVRVMTDGRIQKRNKLDTILRYCYYMDAVNFTRLIYEQFPDFLRNKVAKVSRNFDGYYIDLHINTDTKDYLDGILLNIAKHTTAAKLAEDCLRYDARNTDGFNLSQSIKEINAKLENTKEIFEKYSSMLMSVTNTRRVLIEMVSEPLYSYEFGTGNNTSIYTDQFFDMINLLPETCE